MDLEHAKLALELPEEVGAVVVDERRRLAPLAMDRAREGADGPLRGRAPSVASAQLEDLVLSRRSGPVPSQPGLPVGEAGQGPQEGPIRRG